VAPEAIVILEVFNKTTRSTPRRVVETCQRRLRRYEGDPVRRPTMNAARKKRLQIGGWAVGTTRDFLNLSEEESAYIDIKLRLASRLSNRRRSLGITQVAMAKKIGSSQSRVAKMEAGDPSVTIDLLVRSLIAVGEKTPFADR
jgi:DNA-binding XRE family transcriptional regulator